MLNMPCLGERIGKGSPIFQKKYIQASQAMTLSGRATSTLPALPAAWDGHAFSHLSLNEAKVGEYALPRVDGNGKD